MFFKHGLFFTALFAANSLWAGADWDYKNPAQWSKLNPHYQACSGLNQSPINIERTIQADLAPLKFDHDSTAKAVQNHGHTVQVEFNDGASLTLDGQKFDLKQFHLHSPSENTIHGKRYPMELHLVHASAQGELAVVALMFEEGKQNAKLQHIWEVLPKKKGETRTLHSKNTAASFLPERLDYYRFNGSLTTPPCSEGVRWLVIKEIQQASKAQIKAFADLMAEPNNRPIQPIGARVILE